MLTGVGCGNATAGTAPTITMDGTRFEPASLVVAPGDTVVWINKDPFPHTATADSGSFDSGNIDPGHSWRYVPKKAGVFPYTCKLHPTMKGVLRVSEKRKREKSR
jgi:plastocyanin